MSKILETALKHKNLKEVLDDEDKADEYLMKRSRMEDWPYELPKRIYRSKVRVVEMFGCEIVLFNESTTADHIILYLHGGAYVNEIDPVQIAFCDRLAKKTGAAIFAPIYPLAPNHTYEETYPIVEKLYDLMSELEKPVTIMGDSAGGGLSAAFCEYLAANEMEQPDNLILISPWVDVSMSGDYEDYRDLDPMLGIGALPKIGEMWAGNLDMKDYRISPLFGDVEGISPTTIFVGTHEVLYPDIMKFYDKLKENGVDVDLIVGEEMPHVYPIFPLISESKDAFNQIVDIILG